MVTVRAFEIGLNPDLYPDVYAGSFI
jgi:hypothetical protein